MKLISPWPRVRRETSSSPLAESSTKIFSSSFVAATTRYDAGDKVAFLLSGHQAVGVPPVDEKAVEEMKRDFKEFDLLYLLTGGGPVTSTQTLALLVYQEAFSLNRMGQASAYAVAMMLVMLVFMIVYIRRTNGREV